MNYFINKIKKTNFCHNYFKLTDDACAEKTYSSSTKIKLNYCMQENYPVVTCTLCLAATYIIIGRVCAQVTSYLTHKLTYSTASINVLVCLCVMVNRK